MAYLLWTLHSRLRLLERMDATRKRDARDIYKMQGEVEAARNNQTVAK